jgi:hypothetical protein
VIIEFGQMLSECCASDPFDQGAAVGAGGIELGRTDPMAVEEASPWGLIVKISSARLPGQKAPTVLEDD